MQQVTHQTVRLSKGRHKSPNSGACVMELASMLAGETFTDHPRSVSRTIGAFLRTYNDMVDEDRRQDLYAYAAKVVGTAGSERVEALRAERIVRWAQSLLERRRFGFAVWLGRRLRRSHKELTAESAAREVIRAAGRARDQSHAEVLALLDELIAIGTPRRADIRPEPATLLQPQSLASR